MLFLFDKYVSFPPSLKFIHVCVSRSKYLCLCTYSEMTGLDIFFIIHHPTQCNSFNTYLHGHVIYSRILTHRLSAFQLCSAQYSPAPVGRPANMPEISNLEVMYGMDHMTVQLGFVGPFQVSPVSRPVMAG